MLALLTLALSLFQADAEIKLFAESVDRALMQKDSAALERLTADGFQFIHSTGRLEERASYLQRAVAGQLAVQRNPGNVVTTEFRVIDNTAIRTRRTIVRISPADSATTEFYTRDVYVKSNGTWRWVSAQSTTITVAPTPKASPS